MANFIITVNGSKIEGLIGIVMIFIMGSDCLLLFSITTLFVYNISFAIGNVSIIVLLLDKSILFVLLLDKSILFVLLVVGVVDRMADIDELE